MQNSRLSLKGTKEQQKFKRQNVTWEISSAAPVPINIPVRYTELTVIGRGAQYVYGQKEDRKMAEIDYLFVWDKGWWLKINTIEKLEDYYEHILPTRYEGAINLYRDSLMDKEKNEGVLDYIMRKPIEERIKIMQTKDFQLMYMAIQNAKKKDNMTFLDGIRAISFEMCESDLKDIREDGAVYFNRVGGKTFSVNYVQFCRRKNLIFPDFKESDIRVKQQTGGTHYYAYIGDMQVRDRDVLKWNTFDEAYKRAYEFVTGEQIRGEQKRT